MEIVYQMGTVRLNQQEQDYIDKKIKKASKLLPRNKEEKKRIKVEVQQDKHNFWIISVVVSTPKKTFRVKKSDDDLLVAVDMTEEALAKQIRRDNERTRSLIRKRKRKK